MIPIREDKSRMATKQSRSRRSRGLSKAQPRSYSELYGGKETGAPASASPAKPKVRKAEETVVRPAADTINWTSEYGQVMGDLRQLLIISAALFVLMIVLGFVL